VSKKTKVIDSILLLVAIIILASIVNWIFILQRAHRTFQNYYNFRGCAKLIKKTNDYGTCQLSSGQVIKLVKYQNKWYLDGDLPTCQFGFCF
jgi:hypothetical protein